MKKIKQLLTNLDDDDSHASNSGVDDDSDDDHLEKGEIDTGAAGEAGAARDSTSRVRASS